MRPVGTKQKTSALKNESNANLVFAQAQQPNVNLFSSQVRLQPIMARNPIFSLCFLGNSSKCMGKSMHVFWRQPWNAVDGICAGHSLGGSAAMCAFIHLVCFEPELRLSLAHGGVFAFGAPSVLRFSASARSDIEHCLTQHLGGPR